MPYGAFVFLLIYLPILSVIFQQSGFYTDLTAKTRLSSSSVVPSKRSYSAYKSVAGYDLLALLHPKWPCSGTLEAFNRLKNTPLAIGILWGTFGDNTLCLTKILKERAAPTLLRIHLANSVCVRRGDCSSAELLYSYSEKSLLAAMNTNDQKLKRLLSSQAIEASLALNKFVKEYPQADLKCVISPLLEHPGNDATTSFIYESVSKQLLGCDIVDNPEKPYYHNHDYHNHGKFVTENIILELHNKYVTESLSSKENDKFKCIASMDGESAFLNSERSWPTKETLLFVSSGKRCLAYFLWHPAFNCLEGFFDRRPPLTRRCATDAEIKNIFEQSLPFYDKS